MDVFKEILNFSIVDFADVFLVALLLYSSYKLLRGTVAINIFYWDNTYLFYLENY